MQKMHPFELPPCADCAQLSLLLNKTSHPCRPRQLFLLPSTPTNTPFPSYSAMHPPHTTTFVTTPPILRRLRTNNNALVTSSPARVFRPHHLRMGLLDSLKNAFNSSSPTTDVTPASSSDSSFSSSSSTSSPQMDAYNFRVRTINALEPEIEALSDEQLQAALAVQRAAIRDGSSLDDVADRVFAIVREATFRVLGLRHYDVQLIGGMILHDGCIAEMATGEGKTIAAALPAVLNALSGNPVFIVTVNDYLARRDAELVGQVFRFCGLSVGLIQTDMKPPQRREAYSCDITYVTNSELGFDYLRDNLALEKDDIVLTRPLSYCIVDEADSILIDEARTPLIISGRVPADTAKYAVAQKAAIALQREVHYNVDEKEQSVLLTENGYAALEQALRVSDLFDAKNPWASFITNALKAKELFQKDVNYIVERDDDTEKMQVQIVDEFTGRIMKGRRWSDGLHQAVEAKEELPVENEASVAAKISYQAFFKLFSKLSGMTGTAATEAKELFDIYALSVVAVPTALPMARKSYSDVVFKTTAGKFRAVMREIALTAPTGRPILIGTTSVEASEALSSLLREVEVDHEVLNAKPESALRESEIIAQAGRKFSITIATNMAGRGTDILLGGNADYFARALARRELAATNDELFQTLSDPQQPILIDDDALPVDISEESMNELRTVAARVAPSLCEGTLTLAAIDEIVSVAAEFGPVPDGVQGVAELRDAMANIKDELAEVVEEEREEVLNLGGLYVIGTERAESRRVDNQLRGRAGRQGDPGGSRFFLALDDRMFRVFGGDKVKGILEQFRVDEDTPIENPVVNSSLDAAQKSVEEYFRDIRDSIFKYDEVFSTQRLAFYSERRRLVVEMGDQLASRFLTSCHETAEEIIAGYISRGNVADDFEKLSVKLGQFFAGISGVEAAELESVKDVKSHVLARVDDAVEQRANMLNGRKPEFNGTVLRFLWLTQMDNLWTEHMKSLEYLKEFVSLRSYADEDPLQVYQAEGYDLFTDMLGNVRRNNVYSYFLYNPESGLAEKQGA